MDFAIKSLLPTSAGSSSSTNVVDQDPAKMAEEFAKMLVAQIQNQDPESPLDASEIISQNAQFTASLATVRLANQMAHYEQIASSMRVVGKPAEYLDPMDITNTPEIGVITGADYTTQPPSLIINGKKIPMDNILRVDSDVGSQTEGQQLAQLNQLRQMQMLGKSVEYFDPGTGANTTGMVDEVDLLSAEGYLTINGTSVPMSQVIRIIN